MAGRTLERLARVCTFVGALAIAVMMLATCWDIVARWAANRPLHGVVELVEIMVLASAMLGLPETFLRDEQIRVDLVDGFLPRRPLALLKIAGLALSVVLLGTIALNVFQPMLDARRFGDLKYDLGMPVWPLYALIIFAFAASILTCAATMLREIAGRER